MKQVTSLETIMHYYETLKARRSREESALMAASSPEARERIERRLSTIRGLIAEYQSSYGLTRSFGCVK